MTPFDQIEDAVVEWRSRRRPPHPRRAARHSATAGCISSPTWASGGIEETGLPLPLGGNVVRKDLGADLIRTVSRHLRASIAYGLEHRVKALDHAMQLRSRSRSRQGRHLRGHVRERLDARLRRSGTCRPFARLLERGVERGLIDQP